MSRWRPIVTSAAVLVAWLGGSASSAHGFVYWSRHDAPGLIARANLDGSGVIQDFIATPPNPTVSPQIAAGGGHVYWTNPLDGTIGRATVTGAGVDQQFVDTGARRAFEGLTLHGSWLYWSWMVPASAEQQANGIFWRSGIGRAAVDGGAVQADFISWPAAERHPALGHLAVSASGIFWIEPDRIEGDSRVMRADPAGGDGRHGAEIAHLGGSSSVAAAGDDVYVASTGRGGFDSLVRLTADGTMRTGAGIYGGAAVAADAQHVYWAGGVPPTGDSLEPRFAAIVTRAGRNLTRIEPVIEGPDAPVRSLAVDGYGPDAIRRLSLSPRRSFRGTTVRFVSDKPQTATLSLSRVLPGRLDGGSCVRPQRADGGSRPCVRLRPVGGEVVRSATQGRNRLTLRRRFGGASLRPGRYRLSVAPSADGSVGRPATAGFTLRGRPLRRP